MKTGVIIRCINTPEASGLALVCTMSQANPWDWVNVNFLYIYIHLYRWNPQYTYSYWYNYTKASHLPQLLQIFKVQWAGKHTIVKAKIINDSRSVYKSTQSTYEAANSEKFICKFLLKPQITSLGCIFYQIFFILP